MAFVYGMDFQRSVLKFMLTDQAFCSRSVLYLKEDYFTGELKWFFRKIKQWMDEFHRLPPQQHLDIEISKHSDPKPYEEEFRQVQQSHVDKDLIKKEMTSYIRANIFIGSYRQAAMLYNGGTQEEAYSFINKQMEELNRANFDRDRVTHFGDYETVVDQAYYQTEHAIPTGIKLIDDSLFGGLMPQTWTTFVGGSNIGKSMLIPNLAKQAARQKKKTFVTVHEDEEIPYKMRFLACWSEVPYNQLIQPRMFWSEEQKAKVAQADQWLKQYVVMKFMYGRECFIENVMDEARLIKQDWDYNLLLCDYGQCLKAKAFKTMDNDYSIQGYIYNELKQICLELNVAGAGGAQSNRSGNKSSRAGTLLRMTDVGDSWTICKKSSNVITLTRSVSDMQTNRMTFLLDKARNAKQVPIAVQCVTDYQKCITHVPYDESLQTQIEVKIDEEEKKSYD